MLIANTLWGSEDKVQIALARLREFEPPEGYYVAFSGGKDSQVILKLAELAGVRYDVHMSRTTVEPPELIRFVRREYPQVPIERPPLTMWQLIVKHHMPPTRRARYCCRELKERGGVNRLVVTGIRWEESSQRKRRQTVESCYTANKRYLHPIIDWTESDVWEFHRLYGLPHCELYDEGRKRIGCVMCPLARCFMEDIARWPRIAEDYRRACHAAYRAILEQGRSPNWQSGDDMFEWWIHESPKANPGQGELCLQYGEGEDTII